MKAIAVLVATTLMLTSTVLPASADDQQLHRGSGRRNLITVIVTK